MDGCTRPREQQKAQDSIVRKLARQLLDKDSELFSQHIKRQANFIADTLSRDHHLSIDQLTFLLHTLIFAIYKIPNDLSSWICSIYRSSTRVHESPARLCKSKLGALIDGGDSCQQMASKTSGYLTFAKNSAPRSSPSLPELAEQICLARQVNLSYEEQPLNPSYHMYVCPSGHTYG